MLSYQRYGTHNSTPLVMIHGFLCDGRLFQRNISALKEHIDIITIDLAGFAQSNQITTPNTIEKMALQVIKTLDKLKIKEYYLLGHSMGGMVVLNMALIDQSKIKKLIVYGSNSSGNLPERFESFDQTKNRFLLHGIEETKRRIYATWFQKGERADYFQDYLQCGGEITLESIFNALDAMKSFNISDQMGLIKIKTLVIAAEQDQTYALHHLKKLAHTLPDAELQIIPQCYHNAHLEEPTLFNQLVTQFLN